MNARRVKPIIVKEFRQIRRDRRSLAILLVFPALLTVLIGYALNFDVRNVPLAVVDRDRSSASREFVRSFANNEYFRIEFEVSDYRAVERLLDEGKALAAIVVPTDFGKALRAERDAHVQIIVDGANANTATTVIGYAHSIVQSYSASVAATVLARHGRQPYQPIDFRPRVWYNPELVSAKFLIPGLIGFILMLSAVISTALSVVREKERGTIERIMVSPVRTSEVILGKTIAYLVLGLVGSTLVLLLGFLLFNISIKGSLLWLYAGILLFLVGALGQGLLVSTIAQTQQVAFMIAVFSSLLPSFLLSGFVFPIRSMPAALQVLSNVTPAKFFLVVVRSEMLKGTGPSAYWDQLVFMAIFAAIMLGASALRMIRRVE